MNSKLSKTLKYIFWAAVAAVLLYFSFRGVDWKEFWRVLGQCSWLYVVLAMLAGAVSFFIRAIRWRLLLLPDEPEMKTLNCYDGFAIGKLCDFAVPHVGEFVRCGYVVTSRIGYDKALGTVVLERFWDIIMLFVLIVLLLVFKWEEFGTFFVERILGPASSRFNIGIGLLAAVCVLLCVAAVWTISALRSKSRICGRAAEFAKGLCAGVTSCFKMRGKCLFLLLTVLLWLMFLLMSWFVIKALPSDFGLNFVDALFIMLVGSIAGIVPVPGGFGAFHYLVAIALQTIYAVPFETGIIFATLSHESQAITMIACGLVSYFHQALSRR
ncbi:MAG: lysylphosphatidylglycerol synthase transmembrane domain-containing protein [Bacteroidia bacterium]|nr:lysylphosphatidylglycerol synthase transmembrane domain-containing protein [Bacteroidia bacterium]